MDLIELGKVLEKRRKFIGVSRAELARRLDISVSYVWMVERAKPRAEGQPSQPSRSVLERWANALGWDNIYTDQLLVLAGHVGPEEKNIPLTKPFENDALHFPQPIRLEEEVMVQRVREVLRIIGGREDKRLDLVKLTRSFFDWLEFRELSSLSGSAEVDDPVLEAALPLHEKLHRESRDTNLAGVGTPTPTLEDTTAVRRRKQSRQTHGRRAEIEQLIKNADKALWECEYKAATRDAEWALELLETDGGNTAKLRLRIYAIQCCANYDLGNLREAQRLAELGRDQSRLINDPGSEQWFLHQLAFCISDLGSSKLALEIANNLLEQEDLPRFKYGKLATQPFIKRSIAKHDLLHLRGVIQIDLGNWDDAEKDLFDSRTLAQKKDDQSLEGIILSNMAMLRIRQGRLREALEYCKESFDLKKRAGLNKRSLAYYHARLADVYLARFEDGAKTHSLQHDLMLACGQASALYQGVGDIRNYAGIELLLANIYTRREVFREALERGLNAHQIAQDLQNTLLDAAARRQIGVTHSEQGPNHFEEAEHELRQSLQLLQQLDEPYELALTQRALGALYIKMAHTDSTYRDMAYEYLKNARETFGDEKSYAERDLKKTIDLLEGWIEVPIRNQVSGGVVPGSW